ncbi:MAG: hypothetical protein M1817_004122 [Caeruleum heppii]|nr:MAG: hypothetical protein M1817_004122 [Caeruleum heppii]
MSNLGGHGHSVLHNITPYLIFLVGVTTIGPLQFGFHLAELNAPRAVITCEKKTAQASAISGLPQCIPMSTAVFSFVSSIYTLGGLLGALLAGPCSSRYGRLLTMRFTTLFFVFGPLAEALAPNVATMSIGRFLSGVGAGAAIVVVPMYISEIAPPARKGALGSLTQIMINLGIVITQTLGYYFSRDQLWRVILAVGGGIGLVQFLGLIGVAESPQWMAAHGMVAGARKTLQRVRGRGLDIDAEVKGWGIDENGIESQEEEEALLHASESTPGLNVASGAFTTPSKDSTIGVMGVLRDPYYRDAIIAVIGVMLAQQLCGINSIIMYSVDLLSTLLPTAATLIAVIVSAINLVTTLLCAPLVDKLGRKYCLLLSIAGMGLNSLLLALSILLHIPALSVITILLFVTSFAIGLGPVPFILASELVGQEAVGATQSWALAANWIATFLVAQFFPVLNDRLGEGKVYFLFAMLALGFFGFVAYWVPETKGKRNADEVWGRERRVD